MSIWLNSPTIHGKVGLILKHSGEVQVDRMGLCTGTCTYTLPAGRFDLVPPPSSWHPILDFMWAERSRVVMTPGLWQAVVEYVGVDILPPPVYELNPGVGTEPIETHKDFIETLAGRPTAPLNGARWVDPQTHQVTRSEVAGHFEFDKFSAYLTDGTRNPFAGVTGFLEANQTVWQKSWTSNTAPSPGQVLTRIGEPPGGCPAYGGKFDWLEHPVQYSHRGNAYTCVQHWLLSGRAGWNPLIYP